MREVRVDGWISMLTGLGDQARDKLTSFIARWTKKNQTDLEDAYAGDDVTGRFVDEIPNDGTRRWIKLKGASPEQEKAYNELEDRLEVISKFRLAWKWSRLNGGGLLLVNTNIRPQEMFTPLNLEREGGLITSLVVFASEELQADTSKIISDVSNADFGLPEFYRLVSSVDNASLNTVIHHSRFIRIEGAELPRKKFKANGYFSDSMITKSEEAIRNYVVAHSSIAQTIVDFSVPVIKIHGLADLVSADKLKPLQDRISIMNMSKSMLRMILIDDTETLEHLTRNITGLPEAVNKTESRLVMSTRMPRWKILGEQAGGISGNGEAEERSWYGLVSSERERVIKKPWTRFFILMLQHLKLPPNMSYEFCNLWEESSTEKATNRKANAETDKIYLEAGVLSPQTVQESRFGGEEYGTDIELGPDDADPNLTDPASPTAPKAPKYGA